MRSSENRSSGTALLALGWVGLEDKVDTEFGANVCNNGLRVAHLHRHLARAVESEPVLAGVDNGGVSGDVVVAHAVPGHLRLRLSAGCSEVGEIDVLVCVGRSEVQVEGEGCRGHGAVGLLGVDHDDSLELVVGVGGVHPDASLVGRLGVGLEGRHLRGAVAVADELGDSGVCVVLGTYERGVATIHRNGLPCGGV